MLRRIALCLALSAVAWSGVAQALGLGDIRLNSALNEPLDAEIELLSVTPEELRSLEVFLAPPATFTRYGIDRPAFLARIRFDITRSDGGAVVRLTTEAPITEPFVTMLVEANTSRSRLLREYTVLLDPPVFAERAGPAPRPSASTRPAGSAQPVRRPAQSAPAAVPAYDGDTYVVRRGDTLWEIAERVRPAADLSTNQVMLALFEANPSAFAGNINLISAGATLRIPSDSQMRGLRRDAARAEVRRQNASWRGSAPQTAENGTLRLLPPDDSASSGTTRGPTSASAAAGGSTSAGDVATLQRELAERDRLLAIRDRELAELRDRLAAATTAASGEGAAPTDDAPAVPADASPGVDLTPDPGEDVFVENTGNDTIAVAETSAGDTAAADTGAESPPPVAEQPPRPTPQPVVPAPAPEPSLLDRITGLAGSIWTWVGLGVVALALLLPLLARRRGKDPDSTGTWEALDDFEDVDADSREATSRLRQIADDEDESIVVVESEKGRTTANLDESLVPPKPSAESDSYAIEDTFSSETAINLDQSDPIAEADFHMAYGLYDQAADLINGAIASDPERRDLKEKLAEVYFVWGNQDGFIGVAEKLHDQVGGSADEGWDKIRIMGQQIAPTHALFSGEAPATALESVDLEFTDEPAESRVDLDFAVEDEGSAELVGADGGIGSANDAGGLDFEFASTGAHDASVVDLDAGDFFDPTEESPTIERTAGGDDDSPTVERFVDDDSPTVERALEDGDATHETPTIEREAVGDKPRSDETAEIDLDDLGLDLAGLEDTNERSAIVDLSDIDELDIESSIETLGISDDDVEKIGEADETLGIGDVAMDRIGEADATIGIDDADLDRIGEADETLSQPSSGESVTVLAPGTPASNDAHDETSLLDDTSEGGGGTEETLLAPVDLDDSLIAPRSDDETVLAVETGFTESTGKVPLISGDDVDLDLDDLTAALQKTDFANLEDVGDATIERPLESPHSSDLSGDVMVDTLSDGALDLDIGMDVEEDDDAPTASREDAIDGQPDNRTMTEVGTKLDLARAYIDMGDPEGARSILREVADEGSSAQKQEARKLLDDLAS